jgi:hypothetical protein
MNKRLQQGFMAVIILATVACGGGGGGGKSPPPGTTVFTFNPAIQNYNSTTFDDIDLVWSQPDVQLEHGGGFFINVPPGSPYTVTFVGEVAQGTLVNTPANAFSLRSSKVPQTGTVGALGLVPGLGDVIFRFDSAIQNYLSYTFDDIDGVWVSGSPVDPANGPSVDVAEGFFYQNNAGTATWTRVFNVGP